jgi:hypothetical protein
MKKQDFDFDQIAHDKTGTNVLGSPRWREAAVGASRADEIIE